jgi:hypothetical protein
MTTMRPANILDHVEEVARKQDDIALLAAVLTACIP